MKVSLRDLCSADSSTSSMIREAVESLKLFITRFARVYTPIVVGVAVLLAIIPPLLSGDFSVSYPTMR